MHVQGVRSEACDGLDVVVCVAEDYDRLKRLLNAVRHPAFIGRSLIARCATNGGVLLFRQDGRDAAVVVVNARRNVLLVMCVHPDFRSRGFGSRVLAFVKPNWVRAVESAVPWFEARGYVGVGAWKQGRTLRTRIMVRENIQRLAGRLAERLSLPTR